MIHRCLSYVSYRLLISNTTFSAITLRAHELACGSRCSIVSSRARTKPHRPPLFCMVAIKVENTAGVVFFRCSQTKRHLFFNLIYRRISPLFVKMVPTKRGKGNSPREAPRRKAGSKRREMPQARGRGEALAEKRRYYALLFCLFPAACSTFYYPLLSPNLQAPQIPLNSPLLICTVEYKKALIALPCGSRCVPCNIWLWVISG